MCDPTEWNTFTGVTDANVLHAMEMWLLDEENPLGLLNTKFKITRGCEDLMQVFLCMFTLFSHSSKYWPLFGGTVPAQTQFWSELQMSRDLPVSWKSHSFNTWKWNIGHSTLCKVRFNKATWHKPKVLTQGKLQRIPPIPLSAQTLSNKPSFSVKKKAKL